MDADTPTVGVEEEFLLTDPETGAPAPQNTLVAAAAKRAKVDVQLELTSCQIETNTGVHTDIAALHQELRTLRATVAASAADSGVRLTAAAVPPTGPGTFPITGTERYQHIAETYGMLAREQGLCGCHVHVGVADRETAILVGNHLRPWLPVLLATTANSAVYRGCETGYASWRNVLWQRWPSAGPPPYLGSVSDYDSIVATLRACGSILDNRMIYWDVRPSERFPTVEVRVSDLPATVEETALLAALVRAAVTTAVRAIRRGRPAPVVPDAALRAAYWSAARSGLDGDGLDPTDGRAIPHRDLLAKLVAHAEPALRDFGDYDLVTDAIANLHARGNGAQRQIRALRRRGDIRDVLAELAHATLEGCG